jgi:hypothetical protein
MPRMSTRLCARALPIVWTSVLLLSASAAAQPPTTARPISSSDLDAIRDELVRLRDEVAALRSELAEVKRSAPVQDSAPQQPPQVTPEALEVLKSQIAEHSQTKVESSSRMPVKISGAIVANAYVNSGEANWLENPNLVIAPSASGARGSASLTARQSRIGLQTSGITIGAWQASGELIMDFFAGVPNFATGTVMGLPRLLYAFGRIENDRTAIEVGQDHAILAPRDPTSLAAFSFPLLFRSGNLYLRVPQARVEQRLGANWTVSGGVVAPIAGDAPTTFEFAPPAGTGERSKRPAFEGRIGYARGDRDAPAEVQAGFSAHYGWRRVGTDLTDSWAVAVDANARAGRIGAAGEYFTADNAQPFGGGISQAGRSSGGWAEGRFSVTRRAMLTGGFGVDRPSDAIGRLLRTDNRSAFTNVIFDLTPEVAASIEYRWLRTRLGLVPQSQENHHVNAVFAVKF